VDLLVATQEKCWIVKGTCRQSGEFYIDVLYTSTLYSVQPPADLPEFRVSNSPSFKYYICKLCKYISASNNSSCGLTAKLVTLLLLKRLDCTISANSSWVQDISIGMLRSIAEYSDVV